MWKPSYVVEKDKKRASAVWGILLAAIVGVFVWKVVVVAIKYHNPSTSFEVSDDVYPFPFMEVCVEDFNGCDPNLADCIASVQAAVLDSCGDEWGVQLPPQEEPYTNCVSFNLEAEDFEAKECRQRSQRPFLNLQMSWIPTQDAGGNDTYNSGIAVYLGGSDTSLLTRVPYSRVVVSDENAASEVRVSQTIMAIGKSIKTQLSSPSETAYPPLTMTTIDLVSPDQTTFFSDTSYSRSQSSSSSQSAVIPADGTTVGYLFLTLSLGRFSLTTLSEENPIDIPDFVDSIGGYWAALMLGWGIFFVATHQQKPEEEARSFEEPIEKSKRIMRMQGSSRRISGKPAEATDPEAGEEEQPGWDIAHGGPVQATGGTNGGTGGSVNRTQETGCTNRGTISANEATV